MTLSPARGAREPRRGNQRRSVQRLAGGCPLAHLASTTPQGREARTQAGVGPQGEVLVVNLDALRPRTTTAPSVPLGAGQARGHAGRRLSASGPQGVRVALGMPVNSPASSFG